MYRNLGSNGYTAPEVFERKGYDHMADVWSLGVTLFTLRTGRPPYTKEADTDFWFRLLTQQRHHVFWRAVEKLAHRQFPEEFKGLVNKMLCPDPSSRMLIADALKHPYMQQGPAILTGEKLKEAMKLHLMLA
uniref:mitogen-activated protein kinase kinase n=1 Tax=Lotharella oceanica TaxID=641309 RepID=A0A7S2U1A9_9EUKA|mmetsp:Transcript_36665/g.67729  ORF Transcript_36665/g.67729 Transcript_36665/m.67729 type:complete len:132 (+) Transcript_36665:112-507(+)